MKHIRERARFRVQSSTTGIVEGRYDTKKGALKVIKMLDDDDLIVVDTNPSNLRDIDFSDDCYTLNY